MIKRLNKKGQEGFSTTGLLAMVIGVIALVVLAIFIWRAYSQPDDIVDLIPDEFQKALIYCEKSPLSGSEAQYCNDFKEFKVKDDLKYYSCDAILKMANSKQQIPFDCSLSGNYADSFCARLIAQGEVTVTSNNKVFVSDVDCSTFLNKEETTE